MVRGRARGGKGSLCPPPPPNTPNHPTWTPPPPPPLIAPLGPPPPNRPSRSPPPPPPHSPSLDPPLRCPPPPPRGLRPTVSWGGSWRAEPRGRPPPWTLPCASHDRPRIFWLSNRKAFMCHTPRFSGQSLGNCNPNSARCHSLWGGAQWEHTTGRFSKVHRQRQT